MTDPANQILLLGDLNVDSEVRKDLDIHGTVIARRELSEFRPLELDGARVVVLPEELSAGDPTIVTRLREKTRASLLLLLADAESIPADHRQFDDLTSRAHLESKIEILLDFRKSWDRARELGLTTEDLRVVLEEYGLSPELLGRNGLKPPARASLRDLVDVDAVNRQQMSICRLMGTAHGTFLVDSVPCGLPGGEEDEEPTSPVGALSPYCAYLSSHGDRCTQSEYEAARCALVRQAPVQSTCAGGIRLYSVPVCLSFRGLSWPLYTSTVAVGEIPESKRVDQVAEEYGVHSETLRQMGEESRFWVLNTDKAEDIRATISNLAETISGEVSHKYGTAYQLFHRVLTEHEILRSEHLLAESHRDLEESNRKLKLKSEEIYEATHAITHDLKKPLSVLKAGVGVLKTGRLGEMNDRQMEAIEASYEATGYMQELVEDLLEAARLDAGRKVLEVTQVETEPLLSRIRKRFQFQLDEHGIELLTEDLPESLPCDEKAIEKVLMNLIGNAANYIGDGEKKITLRGEMLEDAVALTVEDTGMGIPEESLGQVFDKFQRGSNVTGIRGTGLGLAIVHGIVKAHGGTVDLTSEVGKGTRIRFTLPYVDEPVVTGAEPFTANRNAAGGR